jgi:hypothetical protein
VTKKEKEKCFFSTFSGDILSYLEKMMAFANAIIVFTQDKKKKQEKSEI